jgi:flagellum-specific ATP synthase
VNLLSAEQQLKNFVPPVFPVCGRLTRSVGLLLEASGPPLPVGSMVSVDGTIAEVVGFREEALLLLAIEEARRLRPGARVEPFRLTLRLDERIMGRVLDGLGRPLDGKQLLRDGEEVEIKPSPTELGSRDPVEKPFNSGIRAINGLFTLGLGQKIGIFSMPGAGKSTLLAMMARASGADATIIALIGERGREAREFIDELLGTKGLERSVVVVVTGDEPAPMRVKGAFLATAIATWLRKKGRNVLLLMDSLTRVAMAQREIGLASGEPPTARGYPPSVFALVPRLVEQAGVFQSGSVTGIYTVLLHEEQDVVGELAKGALDGHIKLSSKLAQRGHYPAIDVLESVSRVAHRVTSAEHTQNRTRFIDLYSRWKEAEELIAIGTYVPGNNRLLDEAVAMHDKLDSFLKQGVNEGIPLEQSILELNQTIGGNDANNK